MPTAKPHHARRALAYFEIDWQSAPGSGCHGSVHPAKPQQSTQFDWTHWVRRAPESKFSEADARLTDLDEPAAP